MFAALPVIMLLAHVGCVVNIGPLPPGMAPPPAPATAPRTWRLTRAGEQCFTRLADCKRRETPQCAAAKAAYPCPRTSEGAEIQLSISAAIRGPLGGASCSFYAYERDLPGYVKRGPARGPQSAKGVKPDGKRWRPPPPVPPLAVPCPQR